MYKVKRNKRYRQIVKYGSDILHSTEFTNSFHQRHHLRSTLGSHLLNVADKGLFLCDQLEKRGIQVDRKTVVRAALTHDLGMLGRDEKYANNRECSKRHPSDSVEAARHFYPDMDDVMEEAILSHMWPLNKDKPSSAEGWVLVAADKMASFSDLLSIRNR